jgi:hypothetical protein
VAPANDLGEPGRGISLALGHADDGAGAVNQQRSQVAVPTLADAEQQVFAAAGVLPRYQAQPGGQLAGILETLRVPQRGHQRAGRQRADARNLCQSPARFILSMPGLDLRLELIDLPVERLEMLAEAEQ